MKKLNYSFELWEETESYDTKLILGNIVNQHKLGYLKHYAFILHDRDKLLDGSPTKPHYMVYVGFNQQITQEAVIKRFNMNGYLVNNIYPVPNHKSNNEYSNTTSCLKYLIHRNAPDKYQYDISDVITDDVEWYTNKVEKDEYVYRNELNDIFDSIVDHLYEVELPLGYYDLYKWCRQQGDDYVFVYTDRKYDYKLCKILEERLKKGRICLKSTKNVSSQDNLNQE